MIEIPLSGTQWFVVAMWLLAVDGAFTLTLEELSRQKKSSRRTLEGSGGSNTTTPQLRGESHVTESTR